MNSQTNKSSVLPVVESNLAKVKSFFLNLTFTQKILLISFFGLLIRLLYYFLVVADNPLSGDAASYHLTANLFADGLGFTEPFRYLFGSVDHIALGNSYKEIITPIGHVEPTAGHPPAWTVLLGFGSFFGLTSIFQQQIFSVFLGIPSIFIAGFIGKKISSELLGLITASLTAVYAFIWINDGLLMAETCAITAALFTIYAALLFKDNPGQKTALLFGLAGGLAALCRAELLTYLPLVAGVILLKTNLSWKERILRYVSIGIASVLIMSPWIIRNLLSFEEPVLLSDGAGTVLVQANCDSTFFGENLGYWDLSCGQPPPYGSDGTLLDESQRDRVVRNRAFSYTNENKSRLITTVSPARIGRMWGVFHPIEQLHRDTLADRRSFNISYFAYIQYLLLLPLSLYGFFKLWKRSRTNLLIISMWIPIATFTAASAFGNTRYRTAAETSIVLLASFAIGFLIEHHGH